MNNQIIYKITFSGMMLSLIFLFQFLEKFMPFGEWGFVNFNFSLIFIVLTFIYLNFYWSFFLLILRFIIGPLIAGNGYNSFSIIGQIILLFVSLLIIFLIYIFRIGKKFFSIKMNIFLIITIIFIASSIVSLLNAFIFSPWYFGAYNSMGGWNFLSLNQAISLYEKGLKYIYFGIDSYWGGILSVYFVFNIINLSLNFVLLMPLIKVLKIVSSKNSIEVKW